METFSRASQKPFSGKWSPMVFGLWLAAVFVLAVPVGVRGDGEKAVALTGETVFCLYHWISGEPFDDRDLEALSRAMGRPSYTDYKPSEMFTRNQLRRLRTDLQRTMAGFEKSTRFVRVLAPDAGRRDPWPGHALLPSATAYLQCELAPGGRRRLGRMLDQALARRAGAGDAPRVAVFFEPVRVRRRVQSRNIALETVSLPLRSVVLAPVRVEVLDDSA